MDPLTPAQQELYDYLVESQRNHHYPSFREMVRAMGLKSPAPIQSRLALLKKKGLIDWTEGIARSVRVLDVKPLTVWIVHGSDRYSCDFLGVFETKELADKCHDFFFIDDYMYGVTVHEFSVQTEWSESES